MGDRANVVIREGKEEVWLYTHWAGSILPAIVRKALGRNERWDDAAYLTRIVFQEMIGNDRGATGYGIWTGPCDNEHDILVLNVPKSQVEIYALSDDRARGKPVYVVSFHDFTKGALTPEEAAGIGRR